MIILGIESSCDETSVAILRDETVLINLVSSQDFHKLYGGVVPELSSRAHLQQVLPLVRAALQQSGVPESGIDLIAATAGPGLIGALLVGFTFAKGFAYSLQKPLIPVNHIEAHLYSAFLMEEKPVFPVLTLIVSGGHTMLCLLKSETEIELIGNTIDDAAGEAFDKVAKMTGLGYPGGPKIQAAARLGNPDAIRFPIAEPASRFDFSFSGLKTAVLRSMQKEGLTGATVTDEQRNDIAASFQKAAIGALIQKTERALKAYPCATLSLAGGVAANALLREQFLALGKRHGLPVVIPAFEYCGDNAAMIAYRGYTLWKAGELFGLDYNPFPSFSSKYIIPSKS